MLNSTHFQTTSFGPSNVRNQFVGGGRCLNLPIDAATIRKNHGSSIATIAVAMSLWLGGTTSTSISMSAGADWRENRLTTPGELYREDHASLVPEMLSEIRRRAALTWDHLATIFGVSRRAVHHWAAGKPVSAQNVENVREFLERIVRIDEGKPFATRAKLGFPTSKLHSRLANRDVSETPILIGDQSPFAPDAVTLGQSKLRRIPS